MSTIAKMNLKFPDGREIIGFEYDFGYSCPEELVRYMFHDGNYSCDCNISLFVQRVIPDFPELECGNLISMTGFEVVTSE